jgi:predicted porin
MMALKKLCAVGLALALPAAAMAQAAAPAPAAPAPAPMAQVYGTLNVNLQYTGAESAAGTGTNVKPRFGLGLDSSNIGVRGTLDVGNGLKVVYQCETAAQIDGEGVSGICNRNSRAGLQGDWGTLFYGNWDTPYKAGTYGTNADDPFGNTDVFGHANIMGSPGYGVRSSATGLGAANAAFDQRAGNSVAYWSPKWAGLSFKLQGSVDEASNADGSVRPFLVAGAVNYDLGGLSLVGQFDYRADYFGIRTVSGANAGAQASADLALRLAAGYNIALGEGSSLRLIGWVESIGYTQDGATTGFKSYGRVAVLVGASYKMGDHELRARYSMALKPSIKAFDGGTLAAGAEDDLGAQNIVVGYGYNLAKSTQLYVYYSQIMNEDRARYTFGVGGVAAVVGANTAAGSDPSAIGLGIRHSF